jgi:hypothetical protein
MSNSPSQSAMSVRSLKRPVPHAPRSRGHSPPEKRARPVPPSPPRSRAGSGAGLPSNVPTGPANQRISNGAARALGDQDLARRGSASYSVQSPGSRSGASTPVQSAPLAPSMLPKTASPSVLSDKPIPVTLTALQSLKLRKQAIFNATKSQSEAAASISFLSNQLKVKETENLQLSEQLKTLQDLPRQMKELQDRLDQLPDYSDSVQTAMQRVAELDNTWRQLKDLEVSAKRAPELKTLEDLKNDVDQLQKWKEAQSVAKSGVDDAVKNFVQQEVESKLEKSNQILRNDITAEVRSIDKSRAELEKKYETIKTLTSGFNVLDAFKTDMEQQNIPMQLRNLAADLKEIGTNEGKTYHKVSRHIEETEQYIGPFKREFEINNTTLVERVKKLGVVVGQVKNFQSELGKLHGEQKKLTLGQDTLVAEKKALEARVALLEGKIDGPTPGFEKVGAPNTSTTASSASTTRQLKQLSDNLQKLQTVAIDNKSLQTQVANITEQLNSMDEHPQKFTILTNKCAQLGESVGFLQGRVDTLESRTANMNEAEAEMAKLKGLRSEIDAITTRMGDVQTEMATLKDLHFKLPDVGARENNTTSGAMSVPPSDDLVTIRSQAADLDADVQSLNEALTAVEKTSHSHALRIEILEDEVPALFTRNFDPFKESVQRQFDQFSQTLEDVTKDVTKFQQQPFRVQSPTNSAAAEAVKNIKQDMVQVQAMLADETSLRESRDREIVDLKTATNSAIDGLRLAFRGLQEQYNNINTDELHGKMVQWFLQTYPSNAANMVQQFGSLQQNVQNLQNLTHWISSQSENITALIKDGPQLRSLVQSAGHLQRLAQVGSNVDEACLNAKEALAKAGAIQASMQREDATIQTMRTAIEGLQQSLIKFNSVDSPFVRMEAFNDLNTQLRELSDSMKSFNTSAGTEHDRCVKDVQAIKTSHTTLAGRVEKLESSTPVLRQDVDTIKHDFMEPNREALAMYGYLLELVGNIQGAVQSICENVTTKDGRALQFDCATRNGHGVNGTGTNKGKSKQ